MQRSGQRRKTIMSDKTRGCVFFFVGCTGSSTSNATTPCPITSLPAPNVPSSYPVTSLLNDHPMPMAAPCPITLLPNAEPTAPCPVTSLPDTEMAMPSRGSHTRKSSWSQQRKGTRHG
ncbi:hypothetical protein JG687_00018409 [Phytophthora cactorum]|uniref:Uncharacterized protein n=1 Tax=Phytophthora cactorum TaxID=29920 RepID=A0A8T1TPX3_9STRA|nr:hypothetical protein JG687_00018409 [Phytophthora cactorum]